MATNRQYTGLVKRPSPLVWFIRKRATIRGRIEHKKRRIKLDRDELAVLEKQLRVLDTVFRAHDAGIDPEVVTPIKPVRARAGPHGEMGRFLIAALKEANGTPVPATGLSIRFLQHLKMEVTMIAIRDMSHACDGASRTWQQRGEWSRGTLPTNVVASSNATGPSRCQAIRTTEEVPQLLGRPSRATTCPCPWFPARGGDEPSLPWSRHPAACPPD